MKLQRFSKGIVLTKKNTPVKSIFYIIDGTANVWDKFASISSIQPGCSIGEEALFSPDKLAQYNVRVFSDILKCYVIEINEFQRLVPLKTIEMLLATHK